MNPWRGIKEFIHAETTQNSQSMRGARAEREINDQMRLAGNEE